MYRYSARKLHQLFLDGKLSAEEITTYFLKRVDTHNKKLGAFLTTFPESALEKARALDRKKARGEPLGKLAAVPVGIKDNIHIKGELTTCGSKFLENYRAPFSATVVELIEKEDAIIIGKLNLDEFAMGSSNEHSAFFPAYNPWNLDCVPGGSSGGSAAAVAARICPITFGSDTGGSVRQPAAFCGVVGFKPTFGRVSRYGLVAFGSSLDQIGPIATRCEDISMIMEVIGQPDPNDATTLPIHADEHLALIESSIKGKRIGIPHLFLDNLGGEAKECYDEALKVLESLGCEFVNVGLKTLKYSVATYYIIATAEASTNLARFDGIRYGVRAKETPNLEAVYSHSRTEGFGAEVKKRIFLGTYVLSSGFQDCYYKQAGRVRVKIIDEFNKAFEKCDVIATPVSPIAAFPKGAIHDPLEMYLQDIYTIGVNLARLPAISVPSGFNKEKKPFGLQLIGQKRDDALVCRMGHAFERAAPYADEIPPEFDTEKNS